MHSEKDVIKKAFRTLSKKYHPDMEGGSQEMFIKIKTAYDELMIGVTRIEVFTPQPKMFVQMYKGALLEDGSFEFLFICEWLEAVYGEGGLRGIKWDAHVVSREILRLVISKELLEATNYYVMLNFIGYDGTTLEKEFKIKNPNNIVDVTMKQFFG